MKFKPCDIGNMLKMHIDGRSGFKEAVYWPHVQKTGQVIGLIDLPQISVKIPDLGLIAQGKLRNSRTRECEGHIQWKQEAYNAFPAGVYIIQNALIHSQAGLTTVGDNIISETIWHTDPTRNNYFWEGDHIVLPVGETIHLTGRTLSLLGNADNYFHSVIEGVARLCLLSDIALANIDHLLLPHGGVGQSELIRLHGLPPQISVRFVSALDTYEIDELILPWTLHAVYDIHPQINAFFDRVLARSYPSTGSPSHIYIDRRRSDLRRLLNEDQVASALENLGFTSVRLERLSQKEQIDLFRNARFIVSPHGAGLTNIGFSSCGTTVVELVMDAYLNWGYRRLAAVRGLRYDCVIGYAQGEWEGLGPDFHRQQWEIDIDDLISTVSPMLESPLSVTKDINIFGTYGNI